MRQIYNGLDTLITYEVFEAIRAQGVAPWSNAPSVIYDFERALQAPVLEMTLRGVRVDEYERQKSISALRTQLERVNAILQRYAFAVWDKGLNPRSTKQMQEFFYGAMNLPEQWITQKGERKLSMNRETLEKLQVYFYAMPVIECVLAARDLAKTIEFLETEVDSDGRMRTSFNIAGTETGRFSSSKSAWGTGGNLQNWSPALRRIFVADKGKKICGIDLEQAESRECGWLFGTMFGDWTYLDACEKGDLHTTTSKLVWPELPWTGNAKADRAIADGSFYRHFSHRDMSKRGGHLTNYYGTAWTASRHLKMPLKTMETFQDKYLSAYPAFPKYWRHCAQELQTTQRLVTPFGRERHFFGRPNDDTTLREAIAFVPQSCTADRMNLGLWRLWRHFGPAIELLVQIHDAVYFQYDEALENEIVPEALKIIEVWSEFKGRRFTVPGEAKVGWNMAPRHRDDKPIGEGNEFNPDGLVKFKGKDERQRRDAFNRVL